MSRDWRIGGSQTAKKLTLLLLLALALHGCASAPRTRFFIGPKGECSLCKESGGGWLGLTGQIIAAHNYDSCRAQMRAAGFLDSHFAGTIGIVFQNSLDEGRPVVARVIDSSPASGAGVQEGDVILEVDGQKPGSVEEAQTLIFGPYDRSVALGLRRGETEISLEVPRAPQSAVFRGQRPRLSA